MLITRVPHKNIDVLIPGSDDRPTVASVINLDGNRLTRHTEQVSGILNGLIRAGIIDGAGEVWNVGDTLITIINEAARSSGGGRPAGGGQPGSPGSQIHTGGEGPPTQSIGREGDYYFQTKGSLLWRKSSPFFGVPPRWKIVTKFPSQGPIGPPGRDGRDGKDGARGDIGPAGADGGVSNDAWTSFTPTWTASGTDPAIGNGTINGAYQELGKTLHFRISIVMGSTTTFGTGDWQLGLPSGKTIKSGVGLLQTGYAMAQDVGTGAEGGMAFFNQGATTFLIGRISGAGLWGPTVPHAWANGDFLRINATIEVD